MSRFATALWVLAFWLAATPWVTGLLAAPQQVFRFTNGTEPESLDPHHMSGIPEQTLAQELFEGLVTYHPQTLQPVAGVATHWQIDRQGLRYLFFLRPEARWSNGEKVVADDFVYSWRRALDPKTASPMAYLMHYIRGAKEFNSGENADFSKVGVRAISAHQLEVELGSPTPYFLSLLASVVFMPVPKAAIEKHQAEWTKPAHFVGNGSFRLQEWRVHQHILLTKSPTYWGASLVKLDQVWAYPIENVETAFNLYEKGKLDFNGYAIPTYRMEALKERSDLFSVPYLNVYYYRLNTQRRALKDERVRRALALAIDRQLIVEKVTKGRQIPALSVTPPGFSGYQAPTFAGYQPQEARDLFKAAGYCTPQKDLQRSGACRKFPKISILYNTREIHNLIALAIQNMWREVLGIDNVELINQEWKVYLHNTRKLEYDVAFGSWLGDYFDPNAYLEIWRSNSGNNRTGWAHKTFDRKVDEAAKELDPSRRFRTLAEAEKLLLEQMPVIPIYVFTSNYLMKPYVQGVSPNLLSYHPLKYVWIEKR